MENKRNNSTCYFYTWEGVEVHNMWKGVWVCAAHLGGFLSPKFSEQGFLFRQSFNKLAWVFQELAKIAKNG